MTLSHKPKYGSVWLVNLNSRRGTEAGKIRPVLVLQNPALLDAQHPSSVIIPLTTKLVDDAEPLRVRISAQDKLTQDSDLLIDQIRAIDNKRFVSGPIMQCSPELLESISAAVIEVLGISTS